MKHFLQNIRTHLGPFSNATEGSVPLLVTWHIRPQSTLGFSSTPAFTIFSAPVSSSSAGWTVFDFGWTDESSRSPRFNWGYDPVNFNVPEGSYSSDPYDGFVRVREFKQMVKGLHDAGLSVVMDVVYNHVFEAKDFCFNNVVPNYFSRTDDEGKYSNGSCCGNDTASERSMVRKYIVDSVKYWTEEYHIDGFRFDLCTISSAWSCRRRRRLCGRNKNKHLFRVTFVTHKISVLLSL